MAISNRERIGKTLDLVRDGLIPFVEQRLEVSQGAQWRSWLRGYERIEGRGEDEIPWDSALLLKVLGHRWVDGGFRDELPRGARNAAFALLDVRNEYAHERSFDSNNTLSALNYALKLLGDVAAHQQKTQLENLHNELLRIIVAQQNRDRRIGPKDIETGAMTSGAPWRTVVTPHSDVLSDTFTDAEFAADLGQVYRGEARDEYGDPQEFFKRTFLTEGLRALLTSAARRLALKGGDPVVELQTGFGGGKTHSMLALYHMCGAGSKAKNLQGIDDLLRELGLVDLPAARRAVFVGTSRSVSDVDTMEDGTSIRTMWGDLAWQLAGREGFDLVADADRDGTAPGSNRLTRLFQLASPCLILIDEWVAFIRQLYRMQNPPPAGAFEANLTFVQSLTESARAVPGVLVVASLPESDIEIGGEGGAVALKHLESVFGRMESPWRAATPDEGFEIVRRRLFEPIADSDSLKARDRTINAFWRMYGEARQDFPLACSEADYRDRMEKAYPIHPSLFDHLYQDWGGLDRFQRTRGVLRMIATIVRVNWESEADHRLILPALVPLNHGSVQAEIYKSLERDWTAVMDKDVEGDSSVPRKIDSAVSNLGRYHATRRVARCLFMGTAPNFETTDHPGIDARRILLGCAQPGETVKNFSDALRRLSQQATYLYEDGSRVWFATKPSVARLAEERAAALVPEDVDARIGVHLRKLVGKGEFDAVHMAPMHHGDVPDDQSVRLVVLGPEHLFATGEDRSSAHARAKDILLHRGNGLRRFRNMLVFLAGDEAQAGSLHEAARNLVAWESIVNDRERLDLDAQQSRLAEERLSSAQDTVQTQLESTWNRVLYPESKAIGADNLVTWQQVKLNGSGDPAVRVSQRLIQDEDLITKLGPRRLLMVLDGHNLWRGNAHVATQTVWEDLCSFLYLPRLRDRGVLIGAIKSAFSGLHNDDTFAYATGMDGDTGYYLGLTLEGNSEPSVVLGTETWLVKLEAAKRQLERTKNWRGPDWPPVVDPDPDPDDDSGGSGGDSDDDLPPLITRFVGSVEADPERLGRNASEIAERILTALTSMQGAKVSVRLEIQAEVESGISEEDHRSIKENCETLKFSTIGFE